MVAKMQDPELNVGLAEAYELVGAAPKSLAPPSTGRTFEALGSAGLLGTVKASNYAEHKEYRINRAFALITARTGASHDGWAYALMPAST